MIDLRILPNLIENLLNKIFNETNLKDSCSLFDYHINSVNITYSKDNNYNISIIEYDFIDTVWLEFNLENKDLESEDKLEQFLFKFLLDKSKKENTNNLISDCTYYFKEFLSSLTEKELNSSFNVNFNYNKLEETYSISKIE